MRYILLSFILLFSFSACTDDSKHSKHYEKQIEKITKETKIQTESLRKELQAKEIALQKAQLQTIKLADELQVYKQAEAQKKIELQQKKHLEKTLSQKEEKLSKLGITLEKNKITLDTNKTKDFLENFAKLINTKLEKVSQDFQKSALTEEDAGIHIDENNVNIDLNKTKDFLQEWGQKMQGFIKEFDTITEEINISK